MIGIMLFVSKYWAACLLTKSYNNQLCLSVFFDHSSKCGTSVFSSPSVDLFGFLFWFYFNCHQQITACFVNVSLNDLTWQFDKMWPLAGWHAG